MPSEAEEEDRSAEEIMDREERIAKICRLILLWEGLIEKHRYQWASCVCEQIDELSSRLYDHNGTSLMDRETE
jgi:hypothetical protein